MYIVSVRMFVNEVHLPIKINIIKNLGQLLVYGCMYVCMSDTITKLLLSLSSLYI